jgi:hypothetical protein
MLEHAGMFDDAMHDASLIVRRYASGRLFDREAIDYEAAKYVYRAAWPDPDLSDYDAVRSIVDAALGIGETDE